MEQNRIRILVADDHPIVREGLSVVINAQSDSTNDGVEAPSVFYFYIIRTAGPFYS